MYDISKLLFWIEEFADNRIKDKSLRLISFPFVFILQLLWIIIFGLPIIIIGMWIDFVK